MKNERNVYLENRPLAEARQRWHDVLDAHGCRQPLPSEEIPVDDSLGRLTTVPVYAGHSSPLFNVSAMDGIAVSFRDTAGASEARPVVLEEGRGFRYLNTGNALPDGFDAVVMIEDVQPVGDNRVEIILPTTPWQHVRTVGEDIVAGELLLPEGHIIRPIDIGAMLATGIARVAVRKIPRAVVIPTGSELVEPGEPVQPGNVIEFNSRILAGYLIEWGARAERHPVTRDDPAALKEAIQTAVAQYDIVVTNAGASAGTEDFTCGVLRELGEVIVHGVGIKPGKPVMLALVEGTPVIGLPGYPVSAVLTLRLFVRDLLDTLRGIPSEPPPRTRAILSRPLASKAGVEEFVRLKLGRVGDHLMATPVGRGAGAVMSLVQADGILTVPAGSEGIGAGETVRVELLRDEHEVENTLVFIGSHDNTLDVLTNILHRQTPPIRLSSAHVGSMGGIMAIKRGEAHIAGTHLLDESTGEYNIPFIHRFLGDIPLLLVNLAYRQQGFLVPRGNPKGIRDFGDLVRDDVSFINRQRGAGTRLLTDMRLAHGKIRPESIPGYDREEYTHMNVASAVATGTADTGIAIRAAAVALDLDFVPVAEERYDLIIPGAHRDDRKVQEFLRVIREDQDFPGSVASLGGYDLRDCGRVLYQQDGD